MLKTKTIKVVEAKNLSASYRTGVVWQNANFTVKSGEFIGLLGPNGAGKTTLIRLLLGLISPSGGQLKILGKHPSKGNPRIGYIPQRRVQDSESKLIALEYVRLAITGTKFGFSLPKATAGERQAALQALDRVDAKDLAYRPLSQLSGGEIQRIFLAQALVSQPDLLLLDEPLANLDIKRSTQLIKLVSDIAKSDSIGVILIAHDINPLLPVIDRIIYIANGKLASGKLDQIVTSKSLSALYNAPIEVLRDSHGRVAVLGVEEAMHHDD
jgi:zinc/manganese transport system ATP-binding protein